MPASGLKNSFPRPLTVRAQSHLSSNRIRQHWHHHAPVDAKSVKALMIRADCAMCAAKAAGANRFEYYSAAFPKSGPPGFQLASLQ
jgi:hypothetical protein